MSKSYSIAIVGATGAVGMEMLHVLERRNFPVRELRLLASAQSAGKPIWFRDKELVVQALTVESFAGIDIALFSAGSTISHQFAHVAVQSGATVIDNSSAFRMDGHVPLIVPEINPHDARSNNGLIANPNCTTAITLMGLYPLHKEFGVRRVIASSYQAVSGSGARGIEELRRQTHDLAVGHALHRTVYPHQIAFNVIPQVDSFLPGGYTKEEMKMQNEGRKIMHLPDFAASVTCVRVPVYRAHSVAVTAQFERVPDIDLARQAIAAFPGVQLYDDPVAGVYPMPLDCAGQDDCRLGRLRTDCALENALSFWICGDQILKGAALNAVQIAELLTH
ncbi:MAG TPA: aspartate-semialdehyde dehydrogenase [Chthoniobacterales bacterium]